MKTGVIGAGRIGGGLARRLAAAGFVPVDLGGTGDCAVMEAPRYEAPEGSAR